MERDDVRRTSFPDGAGGTGLFACTAIPAYLIPEDGRLSAAFMSKTTVCYEFGGYRDYVPGTYRIRHMVFFYENGSQATVEGEKVSGKLAEDIRAGRVRKMEVAVD